MTTTGNKYFPQAHEAWSDGWPEEKISSLVQDLQAEGEGEQEETEEKDEEEAKESTNEEKHERDENEKDAQEEA